MLPGAQNFTGFYSLLLIEVLSFFTTLALVSHELEQGLVRTVLTFHVCLSQQQTSCSQMKAFLDSTHLRFSSVNR
jgi:hypothetical protein